MYVYVYVYVYVYTYNTYYIWTLSSERDNVYIYIYMYMLYSATGLCVAGLLYTMHNSCTKQTLCTLYTFRSYSAQEGTIARAI